MVNIEKHINYAPEKGGGGSVKQVTFIENSRGETAPGTTKEGVPDTLIQTPSGKYIPRSQMHEERADDIADRAEHHRRNQ
ncbi:hypothetical protein JXA63_01150 [Candidatus Woesebacteria bacterium]|nr:hypothetical protein [Candidatus Woesebacteria bacterium]